MLHQTLPTFLSIQSSSAIPLSPPQAKRLMEDVASKALKTSFWPEVNVKTTSEPVCEDVWVENVIPGDDFFVDDLLDFSKEDVFNGGEEEKDFVSVSSQEDTQNDNENISNGVSVKDDFSELSVPADDFEQLEWLSHFVEDSFSVPYPEQNPILKTEKPPKQSVSETETETETESKKIETFATPFPAKARSKRSRTGGRVWSLGGSSETTASSSSSISSGSSASSSSCLIFTNTTPHLEFFHQFDKPSVRKQKKKRKLGEHGGAQMQRRCSHCGVQKTPQWRTGPDGAKTLCNACGVRFKSGRLLPEYRPACSPTFSSAVHSNNHRKVLEMRRNKETVRPVSGFAPPVQSF